MNSAAATAYTEYPIHDRGRTALQQPCGYCCLHRCLAQRAGTTGVEHHQRQLVTADGQGELAGLNQMLASAVLLEHQVPLWRAHIVLMHAANHRGATEIPVTIEVHYLVGPLLRFGLL